LQVFPQLRIFLALVGLLFAAGCGGPAESDLSIAAEMNEVFHFLETSENNEARLWLTAKTPIENLTLCHGAAADCLASKGEILPLERRSNAQGQIFFRSPIFRIGRAIDIHTLTNDPETEKLTALQSLRFERENVAQLPPRLAPGQAGHFTLATGEIFDQGNTEWCWAYASFHVLRTYFHYNPPSSENETQWHKVIADLDHPAAFKSFMSGRYRAGMLGEPSIFFRRLRQDLGLGELATRQHWRGNIGMLDVEPTIEKNLHEGIPSIYCGAGHCEMIYGYVTNGQMVTGYKIADSIGGGTRVVSINNLRRSFQMILTIPRPEVQAFAMVGAEAANAGGRFAN